MENLSKYKIIDMKQINKPIRLIIPDVHGRTFWRSAIQKYPDLPTIFLGDYLDSYTHYDGILPSEAFWEFQKILQYKKDNPERVTLLLGNHDVHYFGACLNSSRKDLINQDKIATLFESNLSFFKLAEFVKAEDKQFLFTHAGIIPEWIALHFTGIDLSDTAHLSKMLNDQLGNLDNFKDFVADALMDRSASRWGSAKYPSMVWADVEDHLYQKVPLPNVYQIFGHTQQAFEPIITEHYANLDCRKSFLLMKDGNIEQVE